jgi:hypothetical protein
MSATTPAAARRDLFDLLATNLTGYKGTPKTTALKAVYLYEVNAGTQTRSVDGVLTIAADEQTDASQFNFTLTIYADLAKGGPDAEATLDAAWWAVEGLLDADTNAAFTRGLWGAPMVLAELGTLVRQCTVSCVRAGNI